MTNTTKSALTVGTFLAFVTVGYFAFGPEKSDPATATLGRSPQAVTATARDHTDSGESAVPLVTDTKARVLVNFPVRLEAGIQQTSQVTDTAQPLKPADTRTVTFVPQLRTVVTYTINASLAKRRFNLDMGPELREWIVAPANWRDPEFRKLCGVDAFGNFPVRVMRRRFRRVTHVATVMVPAGPNVGLPARYVAGAPEWQAFDTLSLEVNTPVPCLMVAKDASGNVIWPYMSGVEQSSNDPSQIFGAEGSL